jgi:hypothetical protein
MFSPVFGRAPMLRATLALVSAAALSGCYGGAGKSSDPVDPPADPVRFVAASGTILSNAVVTQAVTNANTNAASLTVETGALPTRIQTQVQPLNMPSPYRRVDVSVGTFGWFGTNEGLMETNGSAVRGSAVVSPDTWAVFTNTPGSRLDASLGASSLEHSYTGVGSMGRRAVGTTGDFASHAFGVFGGASTTNMPTSGRADYSGSFEGLEQTAQTGQALRTANISGVANLTADFTARTVRGRIDDVNNHSAGNLRQPADYSIGFDGRITDSSFNGASWLTARNSDLPLAGFTQNAGTAQGGFFGPGAAEVAGAVGVSAANANGQTLVTGGFGGKRR